MWAESTRLGRHMQFRRFALLPYSREPGDQRGRERQSGPADVGPREASMTLDVYADLFDDDLDDVAANLDAAMRAAGDPAGTEPKSGTDGRRPKSR